MKTSLLISFFLIIAFGNSFSQDLVSTEPQPRNVVLEEFTGIYCGFCPYGHEIGQALYDSLPGRVVLINIHTGGYADPNPGTGHPDLRSPWGEGIASISGLKGYPAGQVNRQTFIGEEYYPQDTVNNSLALGRYGWSSAANDILDDENSPVNIGAKVERIGLDSLNIDVELYFTEDVRRFGKLNVALLENGFIGYQGGSKGAADYEHNHILRDLITGQWGVTVKEYKKGELGKYNFKYKLCDRVRPAGSHMKLAIFYTEVTKKDIYTGIEIEAPYIPAQAKLSTTGANIAARENGASFDKEFFIKNISEEEIVFETTASRSDRTPGDWTVEISNYAGNEVTVSPGDSAKIVLSITPGETPAFGDATLLVKQISTEYAIEYTSEITCVSKDIKYVHVMNDETSNYSLIQDLADAGYNDFMDISSDDYILFSSYMQPDVLVWNNGKASAMGSAQSAAVSGAILKGINVFVCGSCLYNLNYYGRLDTLGADFIGFSREGWGSPFAVTLSGIENDPVAGLLGSEIDGKLLGLLATLIEITNESIASPIMRFTNDVKYLSGTDTLTLPANDAVIGFKTIINGSRSALLSISPFVIKSETTRKQLINNIMVWMNDIGARLTANLTYINFGGLALGSDFEIPVTLKNSGTENLSIQNMEVEGANNYVFSIDEGVDFPIELAPSESKKINIKFRPTEEIKYDCALKITSNAANGQDASIQLKGQGGTVSVENYEEGQYKISVSPNPIIENAIIELRAGETSMKLCEFVLYDLEGHVVKNWNSVNGANGVYRLDINTVGIAPGIYFIVAKTGSKLIASPCVIL